jgi:hypothetical protein
MDFAWSHAEFFLWKKIRAHASDEKIALLTRETSHCVKAQRPGARSDNTLTLQGSAAAEIGTSINQAIPSFMG